MTKLTVLPQSHSDLLVVRVNGPLFFAAAEKIFHELRDKIGDVKKVIMQWDAVSVLDSGGTHALLHFIEDLLENVSLTICDIQFQLLRTLARAQIEPIQDKLNFCSTLNETLSRVEKNDNMAQSEQASSL